MTMNAVGRGVVMGALFAMGGMTLASPGAAQAETLAREALSRARAERFAMQEQLEFERARAGFEISRVQNRLAALRMGQVQHLQRHVERARAELERNLARRRIAPVTRAPEAWLDQDPADSVYRAARAALNGGRYDQAAALFAVLRAEYPRSGYVADSYYFEALARQRAGGTRNLRRALELVELQADAHAAAATLEDARALRVRLEGALARAGDARAAHRIQERATAACDSEDQQLRSAALGALLQMDADRAAPLLREVLRSRDECSAELRKQAVFLVAQNITPETVDVLLDLAHRDPEPDPEVREAAVFWLSQVPSDEALAALEALLSDSDDPKIQERAVFALSQNGSDRAVSVLRSYAERSDAPAELREQAIFWIGQRATEDDRRYLRDLYGSVSEMELKERVIFGVAQNPSEEDRRWLLVVARDETEPVELRKNALFWVGQSGEIAVDALADLYQSMPDREMREQVIFALAQRDSREAVTALMGIAEDEEDAELRQSAVFWLGQSDDPRVPEFLLSLIRGGGG
jgi:HEAT repeat protein